MSGIGGLNLQGISVSPRFVFGVNGQLRNNLHCIDEHKLLYVAGHNAVVYSTDEANQYFLSGSEGVEGITAVSVSRSGRLLALCERANKARCVIYNINSQKHVQTIPDVDLDCEDYEAKEFLSACFSLKNENQMITLTGAPDWLLILWDIENCKVLSKINIGLSGFTSNLSSGKNGESGVCAEPNHNLMCSYNPYEAESYVCVTGNDTFKYYKIENNEFQPVFTQICNKDRQITTKYSCHEWLADTNLVVCTEEGEIIVLDNGGQYQGCVSQPSEHQGKIDCIIPLNQRGFLISSGGTIQPYEKVDDQGEPYQVMTQTPMKVYETAVKEFNLPVTTTYNITSMCMSKNNDHTVFFITENNQLLKTEVPMYEESADPLIKVEQVHCGFHTMEVTGLDVCIRKKLIVTCSRDKTVRIWNYEKKTCEINWSNPEDCLAVAFHPSGFHLVVALNDKIVCLNVLSKQLVQFRQIQHKQCREIKFCNGGHLFVCAAGSGASQVYNFYIQGDPPAHYHCKGHANKVSAIDWFEDDLGFVSASMAGEAYQWDLIDSKESGRITELDFNQKNVRITSIVNIPGRKHDFYCVGSDGKIHHNNQQKDPYEAQGVLRQLCITHNAKALFGGIGEPDKPGCVVIYKISEDQQRQMLKLERLSEVQAHSKPIERMRLTYDNNHLFTVGEDGCLIIYDVKDRDPKSKAKEREILPYADEILTEKQEIEQYIQDRDNLAHDFNNHGSSGGNENYDKITKKRKLAERLSKLKEEVASMTLQQRNRWDSLNDRIRQMVADKEEEIKALDEAQKIELEENRNAYSTKMLEDAARFQDLQQKKEDERRTFEEIIADTIETHNMNVNMLMDKHKAHMDAQTAVTEQLKQEIETTKVDFAEVLSQIMQDAAEEEENIITKNESNVKQVNEMKLRSNAELLMITSKLTDLELELDHLQRQAINREQQVMISREEKQRLQDLIDKKKQEIDERDNLIGDKEKKIYSLKKKTQELEKFKFVLDYKIKELRKDIAPRTFEIGKLRRETKELDAELRKYNQMNANLGFMTDDLRQRQENMQDSIRANRAKIRKNDMTIKNYKNAVYWCVQQIDDFESLQQIVNTKLYPFVRTQDPKSVEINADIKKEQENQRRYLETAKATLKKRLDKEQEVAKAENTKVMRENLDLIEQIKMLRKRVEALRDVKKDKKNQAKMLTNQSQMVKNSRAGGSDKGSDPGQMDQMQQMRMQERQSRQMEMQANNNLISDLRNRLAAAKQEQQFLAEQFQPQMMQK